MRLIIYLLILANVGFYAWHVYHPAAVAGTGYSVPTWPAGVKRLVLLNEQGEQAGHAAPASGPPKASGTTESKALQKISSPPPVQSPKTAPAGATGISSARANSPSSSVGEPSAPAGGGKAPAALGATQSKPASLNPEQTQPPAPGKASATPAVPAQQSSGASGGAAGTQHGRADSGSGPSSAPEPSGSTGKVASNGTGGASTPPPAATCYRVGPLADGAAAAALKSRLAQQGLNVQVSKTQNTRVEDYWVFLPPMSPQQAVNISMGLAAKGIKDYFIGKDNFISLGIFNGPQSAEQRRQQIAKLGYTPQIKKHLTTQIQYWLAVKTDRGTGISGAAWSRLLAAAPGAQSKTVACD